VYVCVSMCVCVGVYVCVSICVCVCVYCMFVNLAVKSGTPNDHRILC